MKDSQLIYTWAIIFFAACFLATGPAVTITWLMGMACFVGGLVASHKENREEMERTQSYMKKKDS